RLFGDREHMVTEPAQYKPLRSLMKFCLGLYIEGRHYVDCTHTGKTQQLRRNVPQDIGGFELGMYQISAYALKIPDQAWDRIRIAEMLYVQALDRDSQCTNLFRHRVAIFRLHGTNI